MKTLKDFKLKGKRVLVRCDFNVPLAEKGEVEDDFRIRKALPTIEYLIEKGAKVVLLSHLGRPEGKKNDKFSLAPVQDKLTELLSLSVSRAPDCIGDEIEKMTHNLKEGEVLLLENLRFYKGEKENSSEFAEKLSKMGDVYINNAFGVSHRGHASVSGIVSFLPSGAGFLLEKEVEILSSVRENPKRPLIYIIGGAKIESKADFLKEFLEKADYLLIGGKIANSILAVKGIVEESFLPSEKLTEEIKSINLASTKLHLPLDVVASANGGERETALPDIREEEDLFDIGPETVKIFSEVVKEARMIVWAGPLGYFEKPPFDKGTRQVAEAVVQNKEAYKIIGGGDTISALSSFDLLKGFDHISTGGGAMLKFLSGEKLPGLEVLKNGN